MVADKFVNKLQDNNIYTKLNQSINKLTLNLILNFKNWKQTDAAKKNKSVDLWD